MSKTSYKEQNVLMNASKSKSKNSRINLDELECKEYKNIYKALLSIQEIKPDKLFDIMSRNMTSLYNKHSKLSKLLKKNVNVENDVAKFKVEIEVMLNEERIVSLDRAIENCDNAMNEVLMAYMRNNSCSLLELVEKNLNYFIDVMPAVVVQVEKSLKIMMMGTIHLTSMKEETKDGCNKS
jgi:hypothetical protein